MYKIHLILFALQTSLCSCDSSFNARHQKGDKVGRITEIIHENSGIINAENSGEFYVIEDSGNENKIFKINQKGKLLGQFDLQNTKNHDWEDITKDNKGNLYIGDFGNNSSNRKDLTIYKFDGNSTSEIKFNYLDQNWDNNTDLNFDCEAFFWYADSLYLFTKTQDKSRKISKMYVLPDKSGNYKIGPKETFKTKFQVTAAAISPDLKRYVLLTYGKILVFGIENKQINFQKPLSCIDIKVSQTEAITFLNNQQLLFTNEKGKMFTIEI